MGRKKIIHVHARSDEWVKVHRNSEKQGGGCGCLLLVALVVILNVYPGVLGGFGDVLVVLASLGAGLFCLYVLWHDLAARRFGCVAASICIACMGAYFLGKLSQEMIRNAATKHWTEVTGNLWWAKDVPKSSLDEDARFKYSLCVRALGFTAFYVLWSRWILGDYLRPFWTRYFGWVPRLLSWKKSEK